MSSHAAVVPDSAESGEKRARPFSRTSAKTAPGGALGGEPRVSLLPAEVNDFHKAREVRRRLGGAVVVALIVVIAGIVGAYLLQADAQNRLAAARQTTVTLAAEEAQYAELRAIKTGTALIEAGQIVGASTEIDWKDYIERLQAALPEGTALTSVAIDSASPFADYAQSSVPLEGSRVATLVFTATSPSLPSVPDFLDRLAELPGFADAVPGSVSIQEGSIYNVNITMHINSDAFTHRFAPEVAQ